MLKKRMPQDSTLLESPVVVTPALRALMIQGAAFLLVLLVAQLLESFNNFPLTLGLAALLQGSIAAVLSHWRRLASWWTLIQFLFPLGLLLMRRLDLPPLLYLGGFSVLLGLYWTTFRTQVPFYPSSLATWNAIANVLPKNRALRVVDIGSGIGGAVLHLAARRPDCEISGIELAPLPWLISVVRAWGQRLPARFSRSDYRDLSFSEYDVVFAYLSPVAMPSLWQKVQAEMRPGTLLLSYEFAIPDVRPHLIITPDASKVMLYGWYL